MKWPSWTAEEEAALRRLYVAEGIHACVVAIPTRSKAAIFQRARFLGLKTHRRWTEEDNCVLSGHWGFKSVRYIARVLNRTQGSVIDQANILKLGPARKPSGETILAASKRTGYCVDYLVKILRWAKVEIHLQYRYSRGKPVRWAYPEQIDRAIREWEATEYVHSAARTRGLVGETLRAWMKDAGYSWPGGRTWLRIPTAEIDAVVAKRLAARAAREGKAA